MLFIDDLNVCDSGKIQEGVKSENYQQLSKMQNNTYAVIPEGPSTSQNFVNFMPIERRYPNRRRPTQHMRQTCSPIGSSGYGSTASQSNSSIDTVINGPGPYTKNVPVAIDFPPVQQFATATKVAATTTATIENEKQKKPCCVQCREAEIRETENREYENLTHLKPCTVVHPYILLMSSIMRNQRSGENRAKLAKIQKSVEKVLHFEPRESFSLQCDKVFERQLKEFSRDVEIRLRAINDVSGETFRDVSKRFCDALHANPSGLKAIYKNLKSIFTV